MARISFVDLETTGFSVHNDGIVEIGIITTDETGNVLDRYETLLNPLSRMSATRIHGIRAAAVAAAPTFPLIAADVLERLDGSTVIAYNANFDKRFLEHETHQAGGTITGDWVCAMTQAKTILGFSNRKLDQLAEDVGVTARGDTHSAAVDAELCADVFFALRCSPLLKAVSARSPSDRRVPPLPRHGADSYGIARRPFAANRQLARTGKSLELLVDELVEAFSDRELTLSEVKHIISMADQMGLSAGDLVAAYNTFFESEVVDVLHDGVVDADERARLRVISHHLGFPAPYVESRLEGRPPPQLDNDLQPGMTVVLSNMDEDTKWDLTMACTNLGIAIRHNVSKPTDLLVLEGPPVTGKADKARELGIPVMDLDTFRASVPGTS